MDEKQKIYIAVYQLDGDRGTNPLYFPSKEEMVESLHESMSANQTWPDYCEMGPEDYITVYEAEVGQESTDIAVISFYEWAQDQEEFHRCCELLGQEFMAKFLDHYQSVLDAINE